MLLTGARPAGARAGQPAASADAADPAPTVVLLGGRSLREFKVLHELGARILYLDAEVPVQCIPWVDVAVEADLAEPEAVLALISQFCATAVPAAVLTHTEPRIPLMACLAERLGLVGRGPTQAAALNCHDKFRTRSVLRAAGVSCPAAGLAFSATEAVEAATQFGFPVVVKPRNRSGGYGVRMCRDEGQVLRAAEHIMSASEPGTLPGAVVEQYVEGPEYAVQTLTIDGVTEVLSVFAQQVTGPPVFVELGYDYPAGLSPDEYAELTGVVTAALDALGVANWVSHTQVKSSAAGFTVIEVNARRPGGRLAEMTAAVSGLDMVRAASELALGLPVSRSVAQVSHAAYRSIVTDRPGTLLYNSRLDLDALDSPVPPIIEVDIPAGDQVLPVEDPGGGVYGRIVVFGRSLHAVARDLGVINDAIKLEVVTLQPIDVTADVREFKPCC
ncbi:MAG TPA: ATP-grasp domain-containing protein [Streptosporangiaceae bacterium]|nr:ATP-grasp domain-containing protein [Streptosporangiaceae bacterium]